MPFNSWKLNFEKDITPVLEGAVIFHNAGANY